MNIKDIQAETTELEQYWHLRNLIMQEDRLILSLPKPAPKIDKVEWVLNEPKVMFDTCVALLSSYTPRFRLPLTINYTDEEKDKISKAERFLLGIFRYVEENQLRRGKPSWFRELAYWVCSGWYAVFVNIEKQNGNVHFIADILDPMTVYPQWDADGLIKCIRTYYLPAPSAQRMANSWNIPFEAKNDEVKVLNYWAKIDNDVVNCILFDDVLMKPLTKEPFLEIPVFVGAIGSPDTISPNWMARYGESVIASNRDMYKQKNELVSLMVQIMHETAYPNIITKTLTGEAPFKQEQIKGHGTVIPLRLEDQLDILKHAATPTEVNILLSMLSQDIQRGGLPYIVYGGLPFELSGFAISQLMSAIRYKINPYLKTMEQLIARVGSEFLYQFKRGNFGKIELATQNPYSMKRGLFFVEEFSKKDIPDTIHVEVSVPLTTPLDRTQQILFARQALAPPQLLSRETIWDEILDIQDSEAEYQRIIQDQTLEMPQVKVISMLEALKAKQASFKAQGKEEAARGLEAYINILRAQLGVAPAPKAAPAPGLSPEAMPPEAGAISPDLLRAAMRIGTPGLERRPMTEEERQAKEGTETLIL